MKSSYSVNTTIPLVLQKLTDETLHGKLVELTSRERKLTTHILWHLAEVDRRKLYLQMAYPSFFEYLVTGLGYAPASAQRRIDAARLLAQLPQNESQQVAQKIEAGDLNLSQISILQSFSRQARKETGKTVSIEQKSQILQQIENQSVVQTEKILAKALDIKPQQHTHTHIQQDDSVRVELTLTKEEMAWIKQAQDLLSNATGGGLKETLVHLAKSQVNKEQQARSKVLIRAQIAEQSESAAAQSQLKIQIGEESKSIDTNNISAEKMAMPTNLANKNPKTLESQLRQNSEIAQPQYINQSKSAAPSLTDRRQIFQRDQCCQYQDPKTGLQCGSRKFLSVDHIQPQFAGGNHDPQNLRIYCRNHNSYRYHAENEVRAAV
ncbi:MAG: HNH endonuclease [Pseudobdellovibrionaceae bacterium]